jgi:VCBS repeat-containing protein
VPINGSDDATVIGGVATATVTETNSVLATGGQLTSGDPDSSAAFNAQAGIAGTNGYGTFSVDASGAWTYTTGSALDNLAAGQTVTDSFTVTTADGTTQVVTVTINGSDDATVIGGVATATVTETNAVLSTSGQLTSLDADSSAAFNPQASTAGTNGYGSFSVDATGAWTYTTSSALDSLAAGQTVTDSFTVTTADGTTQVVTVTINGTDDSTVIGGVATATVIETNAVLSTGGQLTSSDGDSSAAFNAQAGVAGTNGYGSFSVDATGAWTYTTSTAVDSLAAGQTVTDSFTVTTADGTSQVVTVTINGTNDAALITGTVVGAVVEAGTAGPGTPTATGTLNVSDVDNPATFAAGGATSAGGYGSYTVNAAGAWTYTLDNTNPAVQGLDDGDSLVDSFTVTASDGTQQVINITIAGADDSTVITGTSTGTVVEAGAAGAGTPNVAGSLAAADSSGAVAFNAVSAASSGGYGTYTVDAAGDWTYSLDNANASVQALLTGQSLTDTFTVTAADGTSQVVTVTLNGTDDATVIGGVATATVTEANAVLSTGGQLTSSDPDSSAAFNAQAGVAGTNGYGSFSVDATGAWTYTTNSALDSLAAGQTVTDSFTVTTADGTSQVVTVTINGTDDATVIGGVATATVTETNAALSTGGQLTSSDPDSSAAFIVQAATAGTNGYGSFSVDATGAWSYTTNTAVDNLAAGQTVTDSFTVTTADGTTQVVTVTLNGTDDATVIGGVATATVTETNAALSTSGQLTSSDADSSAAFNPQAGVAGTNGYGSFSVDATGAWTYTTSSALDSLAAGQTVTDSFTVTTADGTTQVVTVTINGTDDATVISGVATATVTETNAPLSTGGQLASADADSSAAFNAQAGVAGTNGYGSFSVDATGAWTYTTGSAIDSLAAGQTVTDSFTVTTADGTSQLITVTINGTDDATVIAGVATSTVTETNAVLSTGGQLTSSDPDSSAAFNVQAGVAGTNGYGSFSVDATGAWTYTTNSALDSLAAGQTVTDSFTATTADGTSRVVTVTINGTDDATVIAGVATSTVIETDAALSTGGQLTSADADSSAAFNPQTNVAGTNGYGSFSVDAAGTWTYTAGSALDGLAAGQTVSDNITVTTVDGTSVVITVTIVGSNDAPVLAMPMLDQPASAGAPFAFTVPGGTFTDVDSALTLSATLVGGAPLPAWLSFDPLSRTFTGTPPAGFGTVTVQVTASDGISQLTGTFRVIAPPAIPAVPTNTVDSASQPGGGSSSLPGSSSGSLPGLGTPPTGVPFGDLPLGQPVDASVPPSSLNPNQTGGGIGSFPDLNALPATGAGPSDALGFPVVRLPGAEAMRVSDASSFVSGHGLFVYHGIPTMQLGPDLIGTLRVPEDAFAHTDPSAVVQLEARLADGRSLPAWLKFEGLRGTFSGEPPAGLSGALEIEVVARDTDGREARTRFVLLVEDLRTDEFRGLQTTEGTDPALGLDVDAKEKEKAKQRLEAARKAAAAGRPLPGESGVKVIPAASFTDQVRAAKAARDPLLDKLVPKQGDRPTPPRR